MTIFMSSSGFTNGVRITSGIATGPVIWTECTKRAYQIRITKALSAVGKRWAMPRHKPISMLCDSCEKLVMKVALREPWKWKLLPETATWMSSSIFMNIVRRTGQRGQWIELLQTATWRLLSSSMPIVTKAARPG